MRFNIENKFVLIFETLQLYLEPPIVSYSTWETIHFDLLFSPLIKILL